MSISELINLNSVVVEIFLSLKYYYIKKGQTARLILLKIISIPLQQIIIHFIYIITLLNA